MNIVSLSHKCQGPPIQYCIGYSSQYIEVTDGKMQYAIGHNGRKSQPIQRGKRYSQTARSVIATGQTIKGEKKA